MGATLADGGMNPLTRERVVDAIVCHYTLALMTTAGLYETSGDWLLRYWAAWQERNQWWDRHRLSGEGRIGNFRPAVGQRGKQR